MTLVSTTAQLLIAIAAAQPGDVIQLAPGTYAGVAIGNLSFASTVTITSQDQKNRAVLAGLKVANCRNLTLSHLGLAMVGATDPYFAFRVDSCHGVILDHCAFTGDPSQPRLDGLYVNATPGACVMNSTFKNIFLAITARNSSPLVVSNNAFSGLGTGGINVGGCSNVSIQHNYFTDFATPAEVHPHCIMGTTDDTTAAAHDWTVTDNLYDRGSGIAAQGILIQDESGKMPYSNVTIERNAIVGGQWNSIRLDGAVGTITITDNLCASWAGLNIVNGAQASFIGQIDLLNTVPPILTRNSAQAYIVNGPGSGTPPPGNSNPGPVTDQGAAILANWLATHPAYTSLE